MNRSAIASFYFIALTLLVGSCKESTTDSNPITPPPSGDLIANPSSLRIAPAADAVSSIGAGVRPLAIVTQPTSSIATATLTDTVVAIHGVGVGSTSIKIGDHSTPQKTVVIAITVATSAAAIIIGLR